VPVLRSVAVNQFDLNSGTGSGAVFVGANPVAHIDNGAMLKDGGGVTKIVTAVFSDADLHLLRIRIYDYFQFRARRSLVGAFFCVCKWN